MRGLYYTGDGTLGFQPPLDETEDATKFCPHCYGSLDKTRAPTILPPPWFDHEKRHVIVGDERRRLDPTMARLLVILWKRPDRLLSRSILMSLLYPDPDTSPLDRGIDVQVHRLRRALLGTPYSILTRFGEGFIFTAKPPNAHAREINPRERRASPIHSRLRATLTSITKSANTAPDAN